MLLLIFWMIALFSISFLELYEIYVFLFGPVLIGLLVLSIVKIVWYNKKKNLKTSLLDKLFPLFIILLLIGISYLYVDNKELYGNDKDSIVKVIQSIEGYENNEIEILHIRDFEAYRIVGFLANGKPSYIEFRKNSRGNYIRGVVRTEEQDSFRLFYPPFFEDSLMMFVTNKQSEIAEIQMEVNGSQFEQTFTPHEASATWIELPQTGDGNVSFKNIYYYDEDGNVIKQE